MSGSLTITEPARFRTVLGHHPTGVALVTAPGEPGGEPLGMVVGTFTSVSLDPPLVGFLPDHASTSWPKIQRQGRFCVNVLAADQAALCEAFGAKSPDRWALPWQEAPSGSPVLDGAVAWIDCELESVSEAGDHWFVLGRVRTLEAQRDAEPLLFLRGTFRSPG